MLVPTEQLIICSVLLATVDNQSMHLLITVAKESKETINTNALLDCRAGGVFMDQKFVDRNAI
jgi:hypothetical protein